METVTQDKRQSNPDLVEAIKAAQVEEKLSQKALAKQIGIDPAMLNQWLQNKYAGDVDGVEEAAQKWLSAREKRTAISQTLQIEGFVETHTAKRILETLEFAHAANDFVVICGGAGMGKTTAARQHAGENSNVWFVTITPACATKGSCLSEICAAVGIEESGGGRGEQRMMRDLKKRLLGTNGLLIIDEAQHLKMDALETIRSLHDATDIGIALMGNESIYTRLTGGRRQAEFAQLFSRLGKRTLLKKPTKRDVNALCEAFRLEDKEGISYAFDISQKAGALRLVVKTIRFARMLTPEGQPTSYDILRAAYENLNGTSTQPEET